MHPSASGFGVGDGSNPDDGSFWVIGWEKLDNAFFVKLAEDIFEQEESSGGNFQWAEGLNVMLNTDIGMFKDLKGFIDISTGECSVDFEDLPSNGNSSALVEHYADFNNEWLEDFADVWDLMITTGYEEDQLTELTYVIFL